MDLRSRCARDISRPINRLSQRAATCFVQFIDHVADNKRADGFLHPALSPGPGAGKIAVESWTALTPALCPRRGRSVLRIWRVA